MQRRKSLVKTIYNIFPRKTISYIRHLCVKTGKNETDFYSIAYIIMRKCLKKYDGDSKLFYQYLNKAIRNNVLTSTRRKRVKTIVSEREELENLGYNQPFNDEVVDFKNFVRQHCHNGASNILKTVLDQPKEMKLYCYRNKQKSGDDVNLMLSYIKKDVRNYRRSFEELKNAREQYNKQ